MRITVFFVSVFLASSTGHARADFKRDYDETVLVTLIRQNTDASIAKAIAEAKRLIARGGQQGDYACMSARYRWIGPLIDVRRFDEAMALCDAGINRIPNATAHVEAFVKFRVQCLLALGRNEQALGHAKVYFNVCSLKSASDAMSTVVECLRAARPNDPELVDRFVREQVTGSTVSRHPPPGGRTGVLESIRIPDAARADYSKRADARKHTPPNDVPTRMSLGNYLLMADRCAEARQVFVDTYPLISDGYWFESATESVARALKAEDGAVGRANAWALAQQ